MKKIKKIVALVAALALCLGLGTNVSATEGSELLFAGGGNVGYESDDASWLMDAEDDDVITLVYTCTDSTHAGWGILGWGATVDEVWTEGPSLSADATDAGASVYWTMTVKEMKDALGIKDNSVVSSIKLGAWNGGKIEGLYISAPDAVPTKEEAKDVDESEVTTVDPAKANLPDLTCDFLYFFTEPTSFKIYPHYFNPAAIPMRTITVTVELESNGSFGGAMGTCVADWAWSMPTFQSDENNCATVTWYLTPWLNNIDFMIWWMDGSQLAVKSITVDTAIDWHALYALNLKAEAAGGGSGSGSDSGSDTPAREPYAGEANASFSGYVDMADSTWWTEKELTMAELIGNLDPATVTSIVFNGETSFTVGYNSTTVQDVSTGSAWKQSNGLTSTVTDMYLVDDPADTIDYATKLCLSKGNGVTYRLTWDVYTNGATPGNGSTSGDSETPATTATASHTFALDGDGSPYTYDLNALFPHAEVGDTVDITVTLSSNGGWFGGCIGWNATADAGSWTSQQIDTLDTPYTVTVPVVYETGTTGQVQQWWNGGADVVANMTFKLNQ